VPRARSVPATLETAPREALAVPETTARSRIPARFPLGVPRLDDLLLGGAPAGSVILLHGPPFCGKAVLGTLGLARAAADGRAALGVASPLGRSRLEERLRASAPAFDEATRAGRLAIVDGSLDAFSQAPAAAQAVSHAAGGTGPLVVVESVSSLLVEASAREAFRLLCPLVGSATGLGGAVLLGLETGMHSEAEVQLVKHLCTGMMEFRRKGEAHHLHVEGLPTYPARPGWIEYEPEPDGLRLTGSFALRRIA
jgi:KaiC/GvpD/RAD55 family RecA-like ATPase